MFTGQLTRYGNWWDHERADSPSAMRASGTHRRTESASGTRRLTSLSVAGTNPLPGSGVAVMINLDTIRDGLVQGEFFLEYLPTVTLADGRCVGAEALARWRRSSGVLQPDEFIHLIEGTHLSGMLTYWAFETVAKELGDWLRAHKEAHISINAPP